MYIFEYVFSTSLISCSKKAIYISIGLIAIFGIVSSTSLAEYYTYVKIICNCEVYIISFFILQFSMAMINKFIFFKTKSRLKAFVGQIVMWVLLINKFKLTLLVMLVISLVIENKYKIRDKEEYILNKMVDSLV